MRDRMAYSTWISTSLGSLLRDDVEAERALLKRPREELRGASPLEFMTSGSMVDLLNVVGLVREECGLV